MKEDSKTQMINILKSHGIEMKVGGCGCCNSPWVRFEYNGETIFDDDDADFNTKETNEASNTQNQQQQSRKTL